ncbi:hypothetical protein [Pseudodesulfovibrio sp. zrk46]|uniref:hypothetical protein n=1 Tax=Pseudodesulfovibrio sp. zrk46 TaxID=2725288 RepID=UPI001449D007|nr:hypothetical protein [Pseudodesulfovibrio sp. zrk46]QJB56027.1 hypothetical protein HFN16_06200 [Pseudodesulfovibrio sp. zrk46]
MRNEQEKIKKARVLLTEFLSNPPPNEDRDLEILEELSQILPDPNLTGYIFYSDEYRDSTGKIDIDKLIDKCFQYKPNVIEL